MELQDTHYACLNVISLKQNFRIFKHLKSTISKGLMQITGSENDPTLQVMATVEDAGVLFFKIKNAFEIFTVVHGRTEDISLSFLNLSHGNVFNHACSLFGDSVSRASMTFQMRRGGSQPEFVRTDISLTMDDISCLSHCTALTSWTIPVNSLKYPSIMSSVVISTKTCNMLQKWLRSLRIKTTSQSVRISLSEILSVMVFSVGSESKTVEFRALPGNPDTDMMYAEKHGDHGMVTDDAVFETSLVTLLSALNVCRVPSICLPCFNFRGVDSVEVTGLQLKGSNPMPCELSVILSKTNPKVDISSGVECEDSDDPFAEIYVKEKPVSTPAPVVKPPESVRSPLVPPLSPSVDVDSKPKTPSPEVSQTAHTSRFYLKDLSCSESEEETDSQKPVVPPISIKLPTAKKIEKRRKEISGKKGSKAKVPKLTFNPLI
ncbi:DNA polymerase processivity subunit [Rhinolophus gammaherpesvirus 1]|uniref:DNA polymerase processivity subunit n=1 Tax=Rhinolophus gammaherpesvirus 1 TaxID=2054179 RepID=A0A2Z5UHZ3_9GAMA|nr:DNA polymerase processivity subunit [Rhinolophus gammaherpesvirus 1]BBB06512.1 DNA polymerase processivity subunit [Rhinolophus gammaherpesvirus 1]